MNRALLALALVVLAQTPALAAEDCPTLTPGKSLGGNGLGSDTPLPACLKLAGPKPVTLRAPTLHQLAAALGTCGPEQVLEGGNLIVCDGVVLTSGLDGPRVRVQKSPAAEKPCAVYFDADGATDAASAPAPSDAPAKIEVHDRAICLIGQPAPVSAATRPEQVASPACTTETNRGGTHVRCGATAFHFAGPKRTLESITISR